MKNIHQVGQNIEQPTKVSNLRPELFVFHGYFFQRRSNTVIEVWKHAACDNCKQDIQLECHHVRTMSLRDEDIRRHGLKEFKGKLPVRGLRLHSESPFFCEECKDKWLKGEALENIQ